MRREERQEPHREALRPAAAPVPLLVPQAVPLAPAQGALQAAAFAPNRVAQRQVAAPVLSALSVQREVLGEVRAERLALQRQVEAVQAQLPEGAAGERRSSARVPELPSYFATLPAHRAPGAQPSVADYVGLYGYEVTQLRQGRDGVPAAPLKAIQRRATEGLMQAGRHLAPQVLAPHLAALQRLPFGADVTRAVVNRGAPSRRAALQRAVNEADADLAVQEQQEGLVEHLRGLQDQLSGWDAQGEQARVMERIRERQGSGEPLPVSVRRQLEVGLNADLSRVRVHTDPEADGLSRRVQAKAFTSGSDIYFRRGQFEPHSRAGLELLAHEVTHAVQQAQGRVGAGVDPDAGLEAEARQAGARVAAGTRPARSTATSAAARGTRAIQRAPSAATQTPSGPRTRPDPADRARALAQLLTGTRQSVAKDALTTRLDAAARADRHIDHLQTAFGKDVTANLMAGTTRQLAGVPTGAPNRMTMYTLPVLGPQDTARIAHELDDLKAQGILQPTLKAFEAQTGKSLYAMLGERVRDTRLRSALFAHLPAPISEAQLTRDAFLENLAVNFVYSNESAEQMNGQDKRDERRGANPKRLLEAFGYTAGEPLSGRWGFQMRVFTPIPGKAKDKGVIIAFRGTEGVALDAKQNPEGAQDTMIGDFAKQQPGYNQFNANAAWIDRVVKAAAKGGRVTMVGHSLGGALAQIAAARYPQLTAGVVVFQAANISKEDVQRVEAYNKAHPKQAIRNRSYRVDGDVVPTAGDATLPGEIYYFDRTSQPKPSAPQPEHHRAPRPNESWPTRTWHELGDWFDDTKTEVKDWGMGWLGDKALSTVPYLNAAAATKGHVVPMLSTYLRQHPGARPDAARQALLQYGQRDENELPHQVSDKQGGYTTTQLENVQTTFGGNYSTARDPRLRGEPVRASAVPSAMDLTQTYRDVYRNNIAFDTVLGHLYALAGKAKSFKAFQAQAAQVTGKPELDLTPEDVALARQLHLDATPRANFTAALKNLFDFQRSDVGDYTRNVSNAWPLRAQSHANDYLYSKFDAQAAKYSTTSVLNDYRKVGPNGQISYQTRVPDRMRQQFSQDSVLKQIWSLYHPEQP